MKIIKKPKILPCECKVCGCIFLPSFKDLIGYVSIKGTKELWKSDIVHCPFCGRDNRVSFEGRVYNDQTRAD